MRRAGTRLGLGVDTTVVALAGPTGAGKSTLFNALAGGDLVAAGRRRPTTATVTAARAGRSTPRCSTGSGPRRRTRSPPTATVHGFVLLDLPDYDSVETSHRLEVERIIELVDLLVWVADPQKYADAALHDRYLKPLRGHGEAMVVVLNQADRLDDGSLRACRTDLERLLAQDGLPRLPVLALSARDGRGLDELRGLLRRRTEARAAAVAAAGGGRHGGGGRPRRRLRRGTRRRRAVRWRARALRGALADAAGVPVVTRAVAAAHRRDGRSPPAGRTVAGSRASARPAEAPAPR